jgi:hypothetical protein
MKTYGHHMEVTSQLHVPAALTPVPIWQEGGWAPEPVWTCRRREKWIPCSYRGLNPGYPAPLPSNYAELPQQQH